MELVTIPPGGTVPNGMGPPRKLFPIPDVYVGSPKSIERYGQYNTMDLDPRSKCSN